jgi:hypothetical protein
MLMMKKFFCILFAVFFCFLIVACTAKNKLLQPGDKIGGMTLVQESSATPYGGLQKYCDIGPDSLEPIQYSTDCDVPLLGSFFIGMGWGAKESKFNSSWEGVTYSLKVDGEPVDLQSFKWDDIPGTNNGESIKTRWWEIYLENLTPGKHTLVWTRTHKTTVDDGFNIYQPGVYERTINFTVSE